MSVAAGRDGALDGVRISGDSLPRGSVGASLGAPDVIVCKTSFCRCATGIAGIGMRERELAPTFTSFSQPVIVGLLSTSCRCGAATFGVALTCGPVLFSMRGDDGSTGFSGGRLACLSG